MRGALPAVELLGLFHARKLRVTSSRSTPGWDACTRGSAHQALLRPLHAGHLRATSRCARSDAALDRALDFVAVCRP